VFSERIIFFNGGVRSEYQPKESVSRYVCDRVCACVGKCAFEWEITPVCEWD